MRSQPLLAFLLAAQMLVYVRAMGMPSMPLASVIGSAALAGAACLTKGPGGLLSCAAVALHLVVTRRGRRAWVEAGVPALVGVVDWVSKEHLLREVAFRLAQSLAAPR